MDVNRFRSILEYSKRNKEEIEENVKDLYTYIGINYDKGMLNISQMIKPLFSEKNYIVIELPLDDDEIGALCYKGDGMGYAIVNSSLPRANVNFALCHEIYHLFYQKQKFHNGIELYLSEQYCENEVEYAANLFAGMIMMPEKNFKFMFNKFNKETKMGDNVLSVVVKLMSYFQTPYMATIIRCVELKLLDGEALRVLLCANKEDIVLEFERLWLDTTLLKPSKNDDYKRFENMFVNSSIECVNYGLLEQKTVDKLLKSIKKSYGEIKAD